MENDSHVFLNGAFVLISALDCFFTACLFVHLAGRVILALIFLYFNSCTILFSISMVLTKLFNHCCLWNGFIELVYGPYGLF